jgi:hypothetical protein
MEMERLGTVHIEDSFFLSFPFLSIHPLTFIRTYIYVHILPLSRLPKLPGYFSLHPKKKKKKGKKERLLHF